MSIQILRICSLDVPEGTPHHPNDVTNFIAALDSLLSSKHHFELEKRLTDLASSAGYFSTLEVSFDYWHYGRHAEHASSQGMRQLGKLFAAAWAFDREVLDMADLLTADAVANKRTEIRHRFG